jgi:exodeoxyribonuclease VII small subunit
VSKNRFEDNLKKIDEIIERLENAELSLDESVAEYETAMKLLKDASDTLKEAEGKIFQVTEGKTEEIKE